jgi:uncharacterized protein
MSHGHRLLLKWARLLHVYLTMFAFLLILFFAITGFVLNHEGWFDFDEPTTSVAAATVPTELLGEPDKLAVVEHLRKHQRVSGSVETKDFEVEDDKVTIVFRGPGRQYTARIGRADGAAEIKLESRGLLGMLTDLHRGKATGLAWGLVIDGVCAVLLLISATGLILWSSLRGRAQHGLAVMMLGMGISIVIYFCCVP